MSDWETNGGGYQKVYGENSAGTSVVLPVNGDAITVAHEVPTTWTQTAVSFGSAGTQVLAANADRLCVLLQNDSDIVQFRLYRDYTDVSGKFGGSGDPVDADQDIVNFDTHIQVDMFGSSSEYAK